jgi:hypothetical protein
MLKDCHFRIRQYGRTELAILYSPNITPSSAWRKMRRWIVQNQNLTNALATLSYDGHSRSFTPAQVAVIVQHLGHP